MQFSNLTLKIITDSNDLLLDEFWWDVSCEAKDRSFIHLDDNPYDYYALTKLKFKYAVLWLQDNEPVYGWLAIQYDKLPSNVIRFFTRMYKLKNFKIELAFLKYEHQTYKKVFKPLLAAEGIDTIFFTRHSSVKEDKWKNKRMINILMGDDINMQYKDNVYFKYTNQTIYYYNTWNNNIPDSTFLENMESV